MPTYSLVWFVYEVKYEQSLQEQMLTELSSTQNLSTAYYEKQGVYVRYTSETGTTETKVKVPKFMLSVKKDVLNLRH